MKKLMLLSLLIMVVAGCAHKVAVVTLESTVQQAAIAAKKAAGNASDKLTIEVTVANGYKGSATVPIPVVPIGVETTLTQSTKLVMDIDLKKIVIPDENKRIESFLPTIYILDLDTGNLIESK